MKPSAPLSKGFWGRSVEELKRLTNIAIKLEGIRGPIGPYTLHSFHDAESVAACKVMSDQEIQGFSHSRLDWQSSREAPKSPHPVAAPTSYAKFHGTISTDLPKNKPEIQRTGYAAWRTQDRQFTMFGTGSWDIDPFVFMALRIKSDGRSYFVNVQTDSIVPTDLHQHRLFARRPGEWETVLIKWNDFVRTNYGQVVEPQTEMLRRKVRSIGIGLTDRIPGPFELCIERIWATNDPIEVDSPEAGTTGTAGLRNRRGQSVKWETEPST